MAQVVRSSLRFGTDSNGDLTTIVEVKVAFTNREVQEDLEYGVNAIVLKHKPDVAVFISHNGHMSSHVSTVPLNASSDIQISASAKAVKPNGSNIVDVEIETSAVRQPAATDSLYAMTSILPEISTALSPSRAVPSPTT